MRFTLTYDGALKPSGSAQDKMDIREKLHPQLAELWALEPLSNVYGQLVQYTGSAHIGQVGGHSFSAVVHQANNLRAELDILMLRAGPPGRIIANSDIDNQLKTLFDALCWPSQQQVPLGWTPAQQPLHCLLQDDWQITRVNVDTARWLDAPVAPHVRLFVRVKVWAVTPTTTNLRLGI